MNEHSIAKAGFSLSVVSLILTTLVSVAALVVSGWGLTTSVSHSTMIEQLTQDQVKLQKQQYLLDQNQKTTEERRQHVGLFLITHLVSIPITEMNDKPKLNFIKMVNLGEQPVINAQARWSFQSLPAEVVQKDPNVLSMVEFCPSEQTIIGKASSSFEQLPKQFGLLTRKVGPIPSTDGILELYCYGPTCGLRTRRWKQQKSDQVP